MADKSDRKCLLFVCVENSNRSQMAEAFARLHGADAIEASSAGSRPSGKVNPRAIAFMAERGCDLSAQASKSLDEFNGKPVAVAVTMGCGDACPLFPGKRYEDWQLDDPAGRDVAAVRPIRDDIRLRVDPSVTSRRVTDRLKLETEAIWGPYGIRLKWTEADLIRSIHIKGSSGRRSVLSGLTVPAVDWISRVGLRLTVLSKLISCFNRRRLPFLFLCIK
jgi:protein-tyrosine-phosphatase